MTQSMCTECGERKATGRGFCPRCYQRQRRLGNIQPVKPHSKHKTLLEVVAEVMGDAGPNDCWPWRRGIDRDGYGVYRPSRSTGIITTRAHRAIYIGLTGQDLGDLQLDHLCHSRDETCEGGPQCVHRKCCNPLHLDPVTPQVNTSRTRFEVKGRKFVNVPRRDRCKRGHIYTPETTRWSFDSSKNDGYWFRHCKVCDHLYHEERKARTA